MKGFYAVTEGKTTGKDQQEEEENIAAKPIFKIIQILGITVFNPESKPFWRSICFKHVLQMLIIHSALVIFAYVAVHGYVSKDADVYVRIILSSQCGAVFTAVLTMDEMMARGKNLTHLYYKAHKAVYILSASEQRKIRLVVLVLLGIAIFCISCLIGFSLKNIGKNSGIHFHDRLWGFDLSYFGINGGIIFEMFIEVLFRYFQLCYAIILTFYMTFCLILVTKMKHFIDRLRTVAQTPTKTSLLDLEKDHEGLLQLLDEYQSCFSRFIFLWVSHFIHILSLSIALIFKDYHEYSILKQMALLYHSLLFAVTMIASVMIDDKWQDSAKFLPSILSKTIDDPELCRMAQVFFFKFQATPIHLKGDRNFSLTRSFMTSLLLWGLSYIFVYYQLR